MKRILMSLSVLAFAPMIDLPGTSSQAHMQTFGGGFGFGHARMFYSSLRSYGEWIELDAGFHAWRPLRVRAGWQPYMYGRWTWTDYGWYWVSYEPFGWAVFHYGRWYYDDYYGWIWVPDDVWGPAWVEWRYNNDYIGWAPLPPYANFSISVGIRFTTRWIAPSHYWCFVRYRHFTSTRMNTYIADEGYRQRLIRTTRGSLRYEVDRDRIINRGVDRTFIERRGNTRILRTEVGETRDRRERIVRDGSRERIEVYRPSRTDDARSEERIEARQPERRLSLDLNRVERNRNTEGRQQIDQGNRTQDRRRENVIPNDARTRERTNRQEDRQGEQLNRRETTRPTVVPDRKRDNEFRMVQPQPPRIERKPQQQQSPSIRREGQAPPKQAPRTGARRKKDN